MNAFRLRSKGSEEMVGRGEEVVEGGNSRGIGMRVLTLRIPRKERNGQDTAREEAAKRERKRTNPVEDASSSPLALRVSQTMIRSA